MPKIKNNDDTHEKLIAETYKINPKTGKFIKVDINDGSIDWGDVEKPICRLFCYYYTLNNAPSFHNAAESYRKCGKKFKKTVILQKMLIFCVKDTQKLTFLLKIMKKNK